MTESASSSLPFVQVPGVSYSTCLIAANPTLDQLRRAVCTLWRQPEAEARKRDDACIFGPLYSTRGIGLMLRTLLANPSIEILEVVGPNLSGTFDLLVALWGADRTLERMEAIRGEFGLEDVSASCLILVLDGVTLCRGSEVMFERTSSRPRTVRLYPAPSPPQIDKAYRGDPGIRVLGDTVAHIWPRLLDQVMEHGAVSDTSYGTQQTEVLALEWVIRQPLASIAEVPRWLGFNRQEGEVYAAEQLLSADLPDGVAYTYGSLMRAPVDQYQAAIDTLRSNPEQRRVYLSTWRPDSMSAGSPPCLVGIWLRREESGALGMWACFRSHDMHRAWPKNLYGLCCLLRWFADELGMEVGTLSGVSLSAHIYSDCWDDARKVAVRGRGRIEWDARSNFNVVQLPADPQTLFGPVRLRAERLSPDGAEVLKLYEGSPEDILRAVEADGAITTVGHALWFAGELYRSAR